jgi:hypothetical protein
LADITTIPRIASGHHTFPSFLLPKLLALPNPWDPAADDSLKMQDVALYNGRYYLYHGAGPWYSIRA